MKRMQNKVVIFWFRRDLRLEDNIGLYQSLQIGLSVIPIFIWDTTILNQLEDKSNLRVTFLHQRLQILQDSLQRLGSDLSIFYGDPYHIWEKLMDKYTIHAVYINSDDDPYPLQRDQKIRSLLQKHGISMEEYRDHTLFKPAAILKKDGTIYSMYTPYSKKCLAVFEEQSETLTKIWDSTQKYSNFFRFTEKQSQISFEQLGFMKSSVTMPQAVLSDSMFQSYERDRNYPARQATSRLSVHLRFGTVSIRQLAKIAHQKSLVFFKELLWREFFMQILHHFPAVVQQPFKSAFSQIVWRNDQKEFAQWCVGETGYPLVDAGMRELNETGYMHNRVRMVVASFLCKHLLVDWRWGEAYFARKLLDDELASNNGNWQWCAGCGCDASPYFRIFHPMIQQKKFDPEGVYIQKFLPEYNTSLYVSPIVEHPFARDRALRIYRSNVAKK